MLPSVRGWRGLVSAFGRPMQVTPESRHALSRTRFFLEKAKACRPDERVDLEALLEASIVFARAAIHRFKTKYERHPSWKAVWDSWAKQPAVQFFRQERDWILKQAAPKLGQKIFVASVGSSQPTAVPRSAADLYYYEDPEIPAIATVEGHLVSLEGLLTEAEQAFQP